MERYAEICGVAISTGKQKRYGFGVLLDPNDATTTEVILGDLLNGSATLELVLPGRAPGVSSQRDRHRDRDALLRPVQPRRLGWHVRAPHRRRRP